MNGTQNNTLGTSCGFNHFSISPSSAVAMPSNKRVHAYGGSSLLRIYRKRKEVEETQEKAQTLVTPVDESPDLEKDSVQRDDIADLQGTASFDRDFKLSTRSRKKVYNRAYAFIRAQKSNRFPFVTLGFISSVSDQQGVKILNKFLTSIRKKIKGFQYLWVAERQEKNKKYIGNIHFHLICNVELPILYYNYLWTICQMNEGLTHENYTISDIHKEFATVGRVQRLSNSLDTKWANNVNSVAAYLTKYISKNKDTFKCAVWHCSRGVSQLCTSCATDRDTWEQIGDKKTNNFTSKKTGKYYEVEDYKTEWSIVRSILNKQHYDQFLKDMQDVNHWILNGRDENKIPNVRNKEFVIFHLTQN